MNCIGSNVVKLQVVQSTNNYASQAVMTKRPEEGTVYVAGKQLEGRGQLKNTWESEGGKNLTLSMVLYPEFVAIQDQFIISKAISLGVADFLRQFVSDVHIKWPNDIYVGDKKIAGILIENSLRQGLIASCIVGLGLNVNQEEFVSDAPNPVSLRQLTSRDYDLDDCLNKLSASLDRRYSRLKEGEWEQIDCDYHEVLYRCNQWHSFRDGDGVFEGKILGVDEIGRLVIEKLTSGLRHYHFKEVEFIVNKAKA